MSKEARRRDLVKSVRLLNAGSTLVPGHAFDSSELANGQMRCKCGKVELLGDYSWADVDLWLLGHKLEVLQVEEAARRG